MTNFEIISKLEKYKNVKNIRITERVFSDLSYQILLALTLDGEDFCAQYTNYVDDLDVTATEYLKSLLYGSAIKTIKEQEEKNNNEQQV